ncbi:MAG: DnaJ domain-containing protein [Gammaproteobacteria bacterium]|nr:DnaJ domain-containing protein [Gammaproteobacteria bacterium]
MHERRNYYRILGVQPDASATLIRGAYRTLMQKLRMHPDLGGDERNAVTVNLAWQVLRDPQRRAEYDCSLLSDYDIRMLSAGGNAAAVREHPGQFNRRNYYRVLGVQADAPQPLIDSAYKVKLIADTVEVSLLEEAYAVLGTASSRKQYDLFLSGEEAAIDAKEHNKAPDYEPLIRSYCAFCKTPFSQYPNCRPTGMCCECGSPLRQPEPGEAEADRAFSRAQIKAQVSLHEYWPGQPRTGQLEELSPDGLCVSTRREIEPGRIVRVSNAAFKAVAKVIYSAQSSPGYRSGMALMTVSFSAGGMLLDVRG